MREGGDDGLDGGGHRRRGTAWHCGQTGHLAEAAVGVGLERAVGVGGVALVCVFVMPEMLGCGAGFVLAIDAHRRPTQLERHEDHQEDCKPAAHGAAV